MDFFYFKFLSEKQPLLNTVPHTNTGEQVEYTKVLREQY